MASGHVCTTQAGRSGLQMFSQNLATLILAAMLIGGSQAAHADGDANAGRKKAIQCAPCHGIDGVSKLPNAPNIAGSPAIYLEKQIKAFRSEERKDETMTMVATPLSDADISDLAAWYSELEVNVTVPQ
jgi:cytochrome c553